MADDFTANTSTTGTLDSGIAAGNIEVAGDHDWFRVTLYGGHNYVIDERGTASHGGTLDDALESLYTQLVDFGPLIVATNDDGGADLDSQLAVHVDMTGSYFVDAAAVSFATGTYTLQLTDLGIGAATDHFQAATQGSVAAEPIFGSSSSAGGWTTQDSYPRFVANINGDDHQDLVGFGSAGVYVAMNVGGDHFANAQLELNQFGAAPSAGGWSSENIYPRFVADVDGDGPGDVVGFANDGVYVALGNGDGTFGTTHLGLSGIFGAGPAGGNWTSENTYPRVLGDVNGDFRADIVGFASDGIYVALAQANGTFAAPQHVMSAFGNDTAAGGWASQDAYPRLLADVNGDGKADIVAFASDGVYVALSQGNGTVASPIHASSGFGTNAGWTSQNLTPRAVADINHDNRADIVGFGPNGVFYALGQADGTFGPVTQDLAGYGSAAGGWTSQDQFPRELGDVTGDFRADIVGFGSSGVFLSPSHDLITV